MKKLKLFFIALVAVVLAVSCGQQPVTKQLYNAKLNNIDWVSSNPSKQYGKIKTTESNYADNIKKSDNVKTEYFGTDEVSLILNNDKEKSFVLTIQNGILSSADSTKLVFKEEKDKDGNIIKVVEPNPDLAIAEVDLLENTTYKIKGSGKLKETIYSGTWFSYTNQIREKIYVFNFTQKIETTWDYSNGVYDDATKTFDLSKATKAPVKTASLDFTEELEPAFDYEVLDKPEGRVLWIKFGKNVGYLSKSFLKRDK